MRDDTVRMTRHAKCRQKQRGVRKDAIEAALEYGRIVHENGAVVFFLGRREVKRLRHLSDFVNLHVVCTHDGRVMTIYRNRRFQSHCS